MLQEAKYDMTKGPVAKKLAGLAIPMMFGIGSIILFNFIDMYFVSKLGSLPVAALTFAGPVSMMISYTAMGLGTATTTLIARSFGENNFDNVRGYATSSIAMASIMILFISIAGLLTIEPLFTLLGANQNVMPFIHDYMIYIYPAMVFLVLPMVGNAAIRGCGNTKFPAVVMGCAAALNLILDPIFIFGYFGFPKMGVAGAGLATLVAYLVTFCISFYFLGVKKRLLSARVLKNLKQYWQRIFNMALPIISNNFIVPLTSAFLVWVISELGDNVVSGLGVGNRVEALAILPYMAIAAALNAFIGQNYGAKDWQRIEKAMQVSFIFVIIWGIATFILLQLFKTDIVSIFDKEKVITKNASQYLGIAPIGYAFMGLCVCSSSFFNGLHLPKTSMRLNIVRFIILQIPLIYLGSLFFEFSGIISLVVVANIIAAIVCLLVVKSKLKQIKASW